VRIQKIVVFFLTVLLMSAHSAFTDADQEKDFAVPAFSDFQLLASQNQMPGTNATRAEFDPLPQIRWLDLNRDRQFNDFDAKQFQAIVESLRGEKLTGLQLALRFKAEQKNQRESFPLLYDLDRDGMFTTFDVDAFSNVINHLDEGADRGQELIQKFKVQLFLEENE
jgi:hypothetical protein